MTLRSFPEARNFGCPGFRNHFCFRAQREEPIVIAAGGRRPDTPEAFNGEAMHAGPGHAGLNPYAVRLEYRFAVREARQLSRFLRLNEWYSFRRHDIIVNADIVNAKIAYFSPPHFCESFLVFGRFLRFENPVKYTRIFEINHAARHGRSSRPRTENSTHYQ